KGFFSFLTVVYDLHLALEAILCDSHHHHPSGLEGLDRLAPRARSTTARQNPRPSERGGFTNSRIRVQLQTCGRSSFGG
ncbi:MAG: hypothetical protein V3W43_00080, partial [Desulfatiglandaceae bacterium]